MLSGQYMHTDAGEPPQRLGRFRYLRYPQSGAARAASTAFDQEGAIPAASLNDAIAHGGGLLVSVGAQASGADIALCLQTWRDRAQGPIWVVLDDDVPTTRLQFLLERGATDASYLHALPAELASSRVDQLFWRASFHHRIHRECAVLKALAHRDPLTGLLNRRQFEQDVARLARSAGRHHEAFALLLLDLDNFKVVNDAYGHDSGDVLLTAVADRIRQAVRPEDLVYRLGGDEFAVLVTRMTPKSTCVQVAERIRTLVDANVSLANVEHVPTASIGLAIWPDSGRDADSLLRAADLALYRAKHLGKNRVGLYTPELGNEVQRQAMLARDLRVALRSQQLLLHFQPQLCASRGAVIGVEALLRWQHPEQGLLMPDGFLDVAEACGLMPDITTWVISHALAAIRRLLDGQDRVKRLRLAINVSGADLRDGEALVRALSHSLARNSMPAELLEVEITEHVVIADIDAARSTLSMLAELGVSIGLDDFGVGYSSLAYLRELPISVLKIDRSFVRHAARSGRDQVLLAAILDLANRIGIETVAEGVETREQLGLVQQYGANRMQGYLIAKPLPEHELLEFLRTSDDCAALCGVAPLGGATCA